MARTLTATLSLVAPLPARAGALASGARTEAARDAHRIRWIRRAGRLGLGILLAVLLPAAPALADSGSMTPTVLANGSVAVSVEYTVDSCPATSDPLGCIHSPMIRLGAPAATCISSDQVIAGFRYRSGNATFQDAYVLTGLPIGAVHLCLWLQPWGPPGNDRLMGEVTFNNIPPSPPTAAGAPADKDCDDFKFQEDAQSQLLPGDPYRLDADHDGIACEDLPSRDRYLSFREAVTIARTKLAHQYARRWTAGHEKRVACTLRTSYRTVGCVATWRHSHTRYRAGVVVQKVLGIVRVSARIISRRPE
jgi:hypothetical protein